MLGFIEVSVPLYAASRQSPIKLSEELSQTFEELKRQLPKRPIVRSPYIH